MNQPSQGLRYHIVPVNRITNNLQYSTITRNRELTRQTHTLTELKFEVTANFFELNPHPNPTSTQITRRSFPSPFVVTNLQFTSTDEPPFDINGEI